jgi:hypothetical protein
MTTVTINGTRYEFTSAKIARRFVMRHLFGK